MKKTIYLTHNPTGLSSKISKWLFILLGLFNSLNGIDKLTSSPLTNFTLFLGIFLLLSGLFMIMLGFMLFSPTSRFTPRVVMDENEITIRADVFNRSKVISWSDIKNIEFKSFAVDFLFNDNKNQLVILPTTGNISIEIKKSLRALADRKFIVVKGG